MEDGEDTGAATQKIEEIAGSAGEMQVVGYSNASKNIIWPDRQIQRRYDKHAADFGIAGHYAPQTAGQFKQALKDFVDQPDTLKIQGTYRGQPVTFYTDPSYGKVVLVSPGGEYVSGWTLNTDQSGNLKQRHSH